MRPQLHGQASTPDSAAAKQGQTFRCLHLIHRLLKLQLHDPPSLLCSLRLDSCIIGSR